MAEITLADYTGYIFLEIIKARQMADQYSKGVAEIYAADPVMKFFSVPRFKVPKMELTIPVLVSGARFSQVMHFKMDFGQFVDFLADRIAELWRLKTEKAISKEDVGEEFETSAQTYLPLLKAFYENLQTNLSNPNIVVPTYWGHVCRRVASGGFGGVFSNQPFLEAVSISAKEVVREIVANIVVDKTTIESLLINPETNVVKSGSSDSSVFTIKAEMLEEGFFIRSVKDESGQERQIVEFE